MIVDLTEPTNECSPEKGSEVTRVEDERLYEDWLAFRAGDPLEEDSGDGADLSDDGTDAGADLAAGEAVYREWLGQKAAQGVDLAVAVGDAVEWGEGAGKGHGVVMELDTSEGWVNVHTCEVIEGTGGRGPALSPTGRTIKMNGAKLRPSPLPIVGESPVGPELSADLAGSDSSGTADLTEEELIAVLDRDLTRMHGGYDGAE